ncbi:hypothetical protein [Nitratifractor salsuginis]|uniref:Uncharacterized protein n=1 Tax=Nitratifractor salsuginis (strain DSM 16511 / JCM 12458 / E9I37-1) TaxID=749222 RepID=E6X0S0_NITSE|nr:hypothetical protein [Nitratifractor salsuginis]ADV45790.1 hypothetical protein Nitsa_0520 [Nitratifractor salsuginis DSM 16511]
MSPVLLNTNVLVYLLSETVLWGLLAIAFGVSVHILLRWDFGSSSEEQYALERRAYLVMTIILVAFILKFLLLPFFVFTIDKLSDLVPGAMCAAGVISANGYGLPLLFLKLLILFLLLLWMAINHYDLEAKTYPWFRLKGWLFVLIFALVSVELWMDWAYFTHIDIHLPVSCCSALFGQLEGANPLPFGLDIPKLLLLFYLLYALILLTTLSRQYWLEIAAYGLFVIVAYYAVVYFFGTYVYELPTHKCPFCMMQRPYHYVGYAIWGTLFGGVFLGLIAALLHLGLKVKTRRLEWWGLGLVSAFVLLSTLYVGVYYLRNGVLL